MGTAPTPMGGRLGRRTLAAIAAVALIGQLGIAPGADAGTDDSRCSGTFENTDGHGTGSCVLQFQGLPVGVQGDYLATEDDRAKVHVELFAVLADGSKRSLLECSDPTSKTAVQRTSASCSAERNDARVPLPLPEPLPEEIVGLVCEAHSHADPTLGPGAGTFTCWSSDRAAPGPGGATLLPVPTAVTAVPPNVFAPEIVLASAAGGLEFHNLDLNEHDVVAEVEDDTGTVRADHVRPSDSAPWCAHYEATEPCPLFWTDLIGTGATARVQGLEDAVPGTTYHFYCSVHPYMQGELVVVD